MAYLTIIQRPNDTTNPNEFSKDIEWDMGSFQLASFKFKKYQRSFLNRIIPFMPNQLGDHEFVVSFFEIDFLNYSNKNYKDNKNYTIHEMESRARTYL